MTASKEKLKAQLPAGLVLLEIADVPLSLPSLQSQLRGIEYRVEIEADRDVEEVQKAIDAFLEAESLPWQHTRNTKVRRYDIRALVEDIWLIEVVDSVCVLGMCLVSDHRGTGRPEQVTLALGFNSRPRLINRTCLILASDRHN